MTVLHLHVTGVHMGETAYRYQTCGKHQKKKGECIQHERTHMPGQMKYIYAYSATSGQLKELTLTAHVTHVWISLSRS